MITHSAALMPPASAKQCAPINGLLFILRSLQLPSLCRRQRFHPPAFAFANDLIKSAKLLFANELPLWNVILYYWRFSHVDGRVTCKKRRKMRRQKRQNELVPTAWGEWWKFAPVQRRKPDPTTSDWYVIRFFVCVCVLAVTRFVSFIYVPCVARSVCGPFCVSVAAHMACGPEAFWRLNVVRLWKTNVGKCTNHTLCRWDVDFYLIVLHLKHLRDVEPFCSICICQCCKCRRWYFCTFVI